MRDAIAWEKEMEEAKNAPVVPPTDTQDPPANTPSSPVEDWEKRYQELQSFKDKQLAKEKADAEALKQQNLILQQQLKEANSKPKSYPVTKEELAEWQAHFPDFNVILNTLLEMKMDERAAEQAKELAELDKQIKSIAAERGRNELLLLHPDANELEKDPQFIAWYEQQEPEIRALIESPNPAKIAKGLTIYKKFMGIQDKAKAKQEADKDASRMIPVTSKPETPQGLKVWTESEVNRMSDREFAKYAEEIDKARREGRFKNDINTI